MVSRRGLSPFDNNQCRCNFELASEALAQPSAIRRTGLQKLVAILKFAVCLYVVQVETVLSVYAEALLKECFWWDLNHRDCTFSCMIKVGSFVLLPGDSASWPFLYAQDKNA